MRDGPFVLLVQFLIQKIPTMRANLECERYRYYHAFSRTWTSKDKYKEISSASIADGNYTFGYLSRIYSNKKGVPPPFYCYKYYGRPTRRLPHAKMLLVTIRFFLCWVDYALEGSTFSLSKCDFSRLFHTGFCLWSAGSALWCNSIFFDLFWIRVLLFSKVPSGSE